MKHTEIANSVREKVYARDSFEGAPCCIRCGSPYSLHLHHFVERSRGGMGIEENLVTLCVECHTKLHSGDEIIKNFCKEYLEHRYKDWNEERLKVEKWQLK